GLLVAYWCRNLITILFPPTPAGVIIHLPAEMDWRVLALSAAVCLISTLLFGLVPAMQARKIDLADAMKSESSGAVGGRGRAWSRSLPFRYRPYASAPIAVDGFVTEAGEQPVVEYNEVGPAYLSTTGIPLISGREFTLADSEAAPPVAVVNETMVQRFWRGQNP